MAAPSTPALRWGASGGSGNGTWNINSSTNWYDGSAATKWLDFGGTGYSAIFSGTAGTVTLASNINVNRLTFQTAGYTVTSNALNLNGPPAIITTPTGTASNSGGTLNLTGTGLISKVVPRTGGLTKSGAGTWSLTNANTYTGNTTVNRGILSLGSGTSPTNLANTAHLLVASGAKLNLNFAGTDFVSQLWLGGARMPAGVYSSANSSYITITVPEGTEPRIFGRLKVTTPPGQP